jgi:hypothetical protein
MGYNARNDEIRDNVTRMQREWKAQRGALATVRRFNATLSAKGYVWFWPKIAAALTSKHHWLIVGCDSCGCAIFFMLLQNASSRLTLVLCPSIMMERLTIADFMMCPLIFAPDRNSNVIRFCSSGGQ